MAASGIIGRFRRKELSYMLGRFRTVRAVYGTTRHILERIRSPLVRRSKVNESSLFSSSVVSTVVKSLREEAVFVGLNLPEDVVAEIKAFALSEPLHAIYDPNGPTFKYADVVNDFHGRQKNADRRDKESCALPRSSADHRRPRVA